MQKKAIFLDRDGVLNKTIFRMGKHRAPYSLEEFEFLDGVEEAVQKFKHHGFVLVIVTNQPDVARGWVDLFSVKSVNEHVMKVLQVDSIKACFHTEKDNCLCRKPMPGMLLEAARELNIDLTSSFMVGDRCSDIEAGKRAGCFTVLIGPGDNGINSPGPDYRAPSLLAATNWIIDGAFFE